MERQSKEENKRSCYSRLQAACAGNTKQTDDDDDNDTSKITRRNVDGKGQTNGPINVTNTYTRAYCS